MLIGNRLKVPEDGVLSILIGTWFMSSRVIISVSLVFATILGLISIADSISTSRRDNQDLQLSANEFVTTVAFHVDAIDYTGAAHLAEIFQQKIDVKAILIKDRFSFVVFGDIESVKMAVEAGGTLRRQTLFASPSEQEMSAATTMEREEIGSVDIVLQLGSTPDMIKSMIVDSLLRFLIFLVLSAVVLALCIRLFILPPLSSMKNAINLTMQTGEPVQTRFHSGSLIGEIISQFDSMQSNLSQSKAIQQRLLQNVQEAHSKIEMEQKIRNQQLVVLGTTFNAVGIHFSLFDANGKNIYTTVNEQESSREILKFMNLGITDIHKMSQELKKAGFTCFILPRKSTTEHKLVYSFEVRDNEQMESCILQAYQLQDGTLSIVNVDTSDLRKAERRIEQMRKMESLGTLTSGVAHEFNNVLAIISNNVELALLDPALGGAHRAQLTSAMSAIERAGNTVEDLLAYSRRGDHVDFHDLPVTQIVRDIQEMVASIAAEEVTEVKSSIHIPMVVTADRDRLVGAVTNLVINGRHAIDKDGEMRIYIRFADTSEKLHNNLDTSTDYIAICIQDNGCGVPEGIRDNIFDPFFTTKKSGSGLGLWTAFNSIQNMDGTIQYSHVPSGGSQFNIFMPASKVDSDTEKPENGCHYPHPVSESPLKHSHIFIMDDEEHFVEVIRSYLEKLKIRVSLASSVSDARNLLEGLGTQEQPDIAICDLHLPDGSGIEITRVIRDAFPECKTIILSGNPGLLEEDRCVDLVLQKPLRLVSLRELLENLILPRHTETELV